jgi:hypothetical protein
MTDFLRAEVSGQKYSRVRTHDELAAPSRSGAASDVRRFAKPTPPLRQAHFLPNFFTLFHFMIEKLAGVGLGSAVLASHGQSGGQSTPRGLRFP